MVAGSRPERQRDVFLALVLTTLVSTSVGWLTAAVVPRELEGTLLLIGVVGLQVSIPVSGAADVAIPYYGPLRLTDYEQSPIALGGPILHSLTWSLLIAMIALVLWRRRTTVDTRPTAGPSTACKRPSPTERASVNRGLITPRETLTRTGSRCSPRLEAAEQVLAQTDLRPPPA
jgi:hypothetical protein